MRQEQLWHESLEDALRSVIDALGGFKKVGSQLRPSLPADQAGRWLAQCLDPERPEKLSLADLLWLLRKAREGGLDLAMTYIARQCGYADPKPINPESEAQRIERSLLDRMDGLQSDFAYLRSLKKASGRA